MVEQQVTKGIEIETFITHSPGGSNPFALRDYRGGQGRVRTERKARP